MPLLKGRKARTKKGISSNIRRMMHEKSRLTAKGARQKQKQAIAIAYSLAGRSRKSRKGRTRKTRR